MSRAVDKAYAAIRSAVLDGEFGTGERLKENDLAATIGVSRTPVREALRRLNSEGLIEFTSNHRAAVAQWTGENINDLFRLRAMLESSAASLAAGKISDHSIQELTKLADAMEKSAEGKRISNFNTISQLNNQFHKIILETAGSKRLQALMAGLIEMTIILRTYHRYTAAELARSFGHHRELIAAFEARDSEWAQCVMNAHILAARASYLRANMSRGAADQAANDARPQAGKKKRRPR